MKADRLLSMLMLLQAHGSLTGRTLAERLEVSIRTIHRDMDALSAAGVPVYATRGSRGAWHLEDGWRTKVPGLAPDELQALMMAQPRAFGRTGLAASAERALTKLVASLPPGLRAQAVTAQERLFVDTTGWRGVEEDLSALPVVQDAVWHERQLTMVYRSPGRPASERTAHPLGLVAVGTAWYLVADTAKGLRTFRVSRMSAVRLLDVPCSRPAGFDLARYWKASAEALRARPRVVVTLRLAPAAAESMRMWLPLAPAPSAVDDGTDWGRWVVTFESESHARFVVLGLGSDVEVVEPAALRQAVRREHATAARAARRA